MISYLNEKEDFYKTFESEESIVNKECGIGVTVAKNTTNVVSGKKLREIQSKTLREVKNFLSMTFGPMGSNTKIVTGTNKETISSAYSKDGLKVLQHIINTAPIEASIIEELIEITRHVEHEVGDGTTSTVILSSLIFDELIKIQKHYNIPPYQLIRKFNNAVDNIKKIILENKDECTIGDIFDISMISTNGDEEVSNNIKSIYEQYGMDVDLSVGISNTTDNIIRVYDGLTITEGMSDPVFITNKAKGTSEIQNASIYHFVDPIDTMGMISYFEAIIKHNIYDRLENDETPIPTVITCPRLSRDMSALLKALANHLYQYDNSDMVSAKPPILIITNIVASDEVIMDDIANLCGCKSIRKYIDPNMLKKDQESGIAPTIENVHEFCGHAELVVADSKKTKFINPEHMFVYDEEGTATPDPVYTALINFLETEIANTKPTDSAGEIGVLKKRLSALKANMVEYLVGGITIADRDATKDLVEDAIKNCRSASKYGVGNAANFEGLYASYMYKDSFKDTTNIIDYNIARCIFIAYCNIAEILYGTVSNDSNEIAEHINSSLRFGKPYDISKGSLPEIEDLADTVKCSIMLDINILDTLSKIITMMVTCNQCLLQAAHLNNY